MPDPWRRTSLRDGLTNLSITATVEGVPELSAAPDCLEVSVHAAAANTAALYATFDGREPTSTDCDATLAAGDRIDTSDRAEAASLTLRLVAASGTQSVTVRPRYLGTP